MTSIRINKVSSVHSPRQKTNRTHLLDLPYHVLESILGLVADVQDRGYGARIPPLPYNILPAAQTCKMLRYVSSALLQDNMDWIFHFGRIPATEVIAFCPYLSDDVRVPVSKPIRSQCIDKPCADIHRRLAWLSLASYQLRSLHFNTICWSFPRREGLNFIHRVITQNVALKDINLLHFPFDPISIQPLIQALSGLLAMSSKSLQTIHVSTNDQTLINIICSLHLPSIKSIHLKLGINNVDEDLGICGNLIQNCLDSGANLKTLRLLNVMDHLEKFHYLSTIHDTFSRLFIEICSPYARLPNPLDFSMFRITALYFYYLAMNEEQTRTFARYIAEAEELEEVNLYGCTLSNFSSAFAKYKRAMGKKLKQLHILDKENEILDDISTYCENVEHLVLDCDESKLDKVGKILEKSTKLKRFYMTIRGLDGSKKDGVSALIRGAERSVAPLEKLDIWNPLDEVEEMCRLIRSFRETLQCVIIKTPGCRRDGVELGFLEEIINLIDESNDFQNLKELYIPLKTMKVRHVDDEAVHMAIVLIAAVERLQRRFQHFDGSFLISELQHVQRLGWQRMTEEFNTRCSDAYSSDSDSC